MYFLTDKISVMVVYTVSYSQYLAEFHASSMQKITFYLLFKKTKLYLKIEF